MNSQKAKLNPVLEIVGNLRPSEHYVSTEPCADYIRQIFINARKSAKRLFSKAELIAKTPPAQNHYYLRGRQLSPARVLQRRMSAAVPSRTVRVKSRPMSSPGRKQPREKEAKQRGLLRSLSGWQFVTN